jgi:hypothetical protein
MENKTPIHLMNRFSEANVMRAQTADGPLRETNLVGSSSVDMLPKINEKDKQVSERPKNANQKTRPISILKGTKQDSSNRDKVSLDEEIGKDDLKGSPGSNKENVQHKINRPKTTPTP